MVLTPRDRTKQATWGGKFVLGANEDGFKEDFTELRVSRNNNRRRGNLRSRALAHTGSNALANNTLTISVIISLLIHLLAFKIALAPTDYSAIDTQSVMNVELLPNLPPLPEARLEKALQRPKQIVSQPAEPSEQASPQAPDTNLLSERDQAVAKEQIMRGDPLAGPVVAPRSLARQNPGVAGGATGAAAPSQPAGKQAQAKSHAKSQAKSAARNAQGSSEPAPQQAPPSTAPRLKTLALDQGTLLSKFAVPTGRDNSDNDSLKGAKAAAAKNLSQLTASATSSSMLSGQGYTPFSRPMGSGAQFMGRYGSSDYLPNLPDGDITLLNTKADQFAVFVRRVATRVFSELRSAGWETLSAGEIRRIEGFATVKAELSLDGKLLSVTTINASGSPRFDATLTEATTRGAADPHPPQAAKAPNGNIIFIFQAKSWSEPAMNRRTGTPTERRWLLLAAGLG